MHISKIELENIKSHDASIIEFSRGTTAITGENGAGKTTIIEAIAWVLFDLLDYKKEEFVKRGEKKGVVRVTFESGLDEREYIVYRDSGAGYHVTDPRLQTRIADKKEEVFRFLWQHLGLEPGTDLRSLFKQAIGVPQGTFTAIFLEGATERKVAFDRLLKVEEYRQAAEKLRETSRFLDVSIASVRENIARAEGELSRSETVEDEYKIVSEQFQLLSTNVEKISSEIQARGSRVKELDEQKRRLSDLQAELDRGRSNKEKEEIVIRQVESAFSRAKDASAKIEIVRDGHEKHVAILGRLTEMERERKIRDQFNSQLVQTNTAIASVKAEQKRHDHELNNIAAAREEIENLRSKAAQQQEIEIEINSLRERIAGARVADERIRSIDRELVGKRDMYRENQDRISTAEALSASSDSLEKLEKQNNELLSNLAGMRAKLERDEQFKIAIKDGLCPIISEKCLNLKAGETLENFVSNQYADVNSEINDLEKQHESIIKELELARNGQKYHVALETYSNRTVEIQSEADELIAKKASLLAEQQSLGEFERQFAELQSKLKMLADPSARIRILEQSLTKETDIRTALSEVEKNLERLETERKSLVEQLDTHSDLDKQWTNLIAERDATVDAHRVYIANETEAGLIEIRQKELETTKQQIAEATSSIEKAETAFQAAGGNYDAARHQIERTELTNSERNLIEIQTRSDATQRRRDQLANELEHFAKIRGNLASEFKEKERLETVAETTTFIRDTLKEAAPRVARNYVYHVSLEANQMFREITGNAEQSLKWGEDYAIMLEEDGYERPFTSLSGGEQMAAALAVRLALLKQLTDIRIAFFDEPTTNMDAERRENLAMQISRITHFDQLFVISHDETFDSYVDNVVAIG